MAVFSYCAILQHECVIFHDCLTLLHCLTDLFCYDTTGPFYLTTRLHDCVISQHDYVILQH